jgi:hypothetical protein
VTQANPDGDAGGLLDTSVFIAREGGQPLGQLPDTFLAIPQVQVFRV